MQKKCLNCGHDHQATPDFCTNITCPCKSYQKRPKKLISTKPEGEKTQWSRVTFTLDNELEAKLRKIQAKLVMSRHRKVSFSEVINKLLGESIVARSEQYMLTH